MNQPPHSYLGQQLGTYRIIRELGTGGFAKVYLGQHIQQNWEVAIKILTINYADKKSFSKEADTVWKLHHPHIVKILGYDIDNGVPYLVMEYASKGSLRDLHPRGQPLPQPGILHYVTQIADALDYIHQHRLVHCDIKPPNFLVRANGEVLLSDFGIATEAVTTSLRSMSLPASAMAVLGTPQYITPEQALGHKLTPATDQYALGIVVYEWLCGQPPFTGPDAYTICQAHINQPVPPFNDNTISAELEDVVMRALAKAPKDRYPSILDFAHALDDAIQNRPIFDPQQGQNQGIPQNIMGGGIWSQLQPQNSFTLPSPGGGYNDTTIPSAPQQSSQLLQQTSNLFWIGSKTSDTRNKRNKRSPKRRRPPRFDWGYLQDTNNQPFLWIGIICDLLCVIPLFLWLHHLDTLPMANLPYPDWVLSQPYLSWVINLSYLNWVITPPLLAIITRFLCVAAIKPTTARPFAWILTAYETLAIFGLVVYLDINLPILWIVTAIIAWFLNDFFYARNK